MAAINRDQVNEFFETMTDDDKAKMAADLLSDTRCDDKVFATFFATLDDTAHCELLSRAEDENDRADQEEEEDDN